MRSRFSGRGVIQSRQGLDRAQVRVQAQALAQPEQALLGTGGVRVGRVPLGPADRRKEHSVGGAAGREGLLGQGDTVQVDRRAPERMLLELELPDRFQHPQRGQP